MSDPIAELSRAAAGLRDDAEDLARRMESEGVAACVYNPRMYAWDIHEEFIRVVIPHGQPFMGSHRPYLQ